MRAGYGIVTPRGDDDVTEGEPMKPVILTFSIPLLLALAAPAQGQTVPADDTATHQPLNLSLPRDLARPSAMPSGVAAAHDPVEQNLRPAQIDGKRDASRMPYGSGYEARQRGAADRGDTAAHGSRGGSGGMQGGGRGGMGRKR